MYALAAELGHTVSLNYRLPHIPPAALALRFAIRLYRPAG